MIENKRIKIGIISDTDGLLRTEVLDILQSCDCIFHAGDVDRPELLDTIRSLGTESAKKLELYSWKCEILYGS